MINNDIMYIINHIEDISSESLAHVIGFRIQLCELKMNSFV